MASTSAMTSLHTVSSSRLLSTPRTQSRRGSRFTVVRAEDNKQRLDFKPNQRSGIGYLDEDSAGQTNIFAVEPRTYVKGSQRDDASGTTLLVGGGAAAIGGLILAAGLLGGSGNPAGQNSPADEGLQSLSQYSQQFSSEGAASAPSLN